MYEYNYNYYDVPVVSNIELTDEDIENIGKSQCARISMRPDFIEVEVQDGWIVAKPVVMKRHKFERVRRITGYLVGTLDRFNDAKRSEVEHRVKHNV